MLVILVIAETPNNHLGCINPYTLLWDKLPTSTGEFTGFSEPSTVWLGTGSFDEIDWKSSCDSAEGSPRWLVGLEFLYPTVGDVVGPVLGYTP